MLTKKQYELLMYIDAYLRNNGVSPSFEEMKEALNLRSKSGIHRLITGLEERRFIRRMPHRARALEILRMPSGASKPPTQEQGPQEQGPQEQGTCAGTGPRLNVIKGNFKASGARMPNLTLSRISGKSMELPLWGRIAAGTPIEALRNHSDTVEVPASLLAGGEHYALTVEGDSMIEAGILDGDTVIIQSAKMANSGTIVVALVNDEEVTLKRLRRRGQSIALEPANKNYKTRICGLDQVQVQGKLVGLIRKY